MKYLVNRPVWCLSHLMNLFKRLQGRWVYCQSRVWFAQDYVYWSARNSRLVYTWFFMVKLFHYTSTCALYSLLSLFARVWCITNFRLAENAKRIASTGKPVHWMTPLNLPIVQGIVLCNSLSFVKSKKGYDLTIDQRILSLSSNTFSTTRITLHVLAFVSRVDSYITSLICLSYYPT